MVAMQNMITLRRSTGDKSSQPSREKYFTIPVRNDKKILNVGIFGVEMRFKGLQRNFY